MAYITRYPLLSHLRADPSRHVLYWKNGKLVKSGRGLAFWFTRLSASIAELPCDDRELPFVFHARSQDYQDVVTQGVVTWRVVDPDVLAERLDFSVDLRTGRWCEQPLEQLAEIVTGRAQQFAWSHLAAHDVRNLIAAGVGPVRERVLKGLEHDAALRAMGLEVVGVAVSQIAPTSELEKALQMPALESIQQHADEATFGRRALAVEKERAIQENELQNQIELAAREADLISQRGANEQRRAHEQAATTTIALESSTAVTRLEAAARADSIRITEEVSVQAERERIQIYEQLAPHVLLGLAAREFAGKLQKIEHLNVTPDMLGTLFGDLVQAGTGFLAAGPAQAVAPTAAEQG